MLLMVIFATCACFAWIEIRLREMNKRGIKTCLTLYQLLEVHSPKLGMNACMWLRGPLNKAHLYEVYEEALREKTGLTH